MYARAVICQCWLMVDAHTTHSLIDFISHLFAVVTTALMHWHRVNRFWWTRARVSIVCHLAEVNHVFWLSMRGGRRCCQSTAWHPEINSFSSIDRYEFYETIHWSGLGKHTVRIMKYYICFYHRTVRSISIYQYFHNLRCISPIHVSTFIVHTSHETIWKRSFWIAIQSQWAITSRSSAYKAVTCKTLRLFIFIKIILKRSHPLAHFIPIKYPIIITKYNFEVAAAICSF